MAGLQRFEDAQARTENGFTAALDELRAGGKRGHWIWYIFPQLSGLGRSPTAEFFALTDIREAIAYLRNPVLRGRLLEATTAVAELTRAGQSLAVTMGSSLDALKLVSSLTLFGELAARLRQEQADVELSRLASVAAEVLEAASEEGYQPCPFTLGRLASNTLHSPGRNRGKA